MSGVNREEQGRTNNKRYNFQNKQRDCELESFCDLIITVTESNHCTGAACRHDIRHPCGAGGDKDDSLNIKSAGQRRGRSNRDHESHCTHIGEEVRHDSCNQCEHCDDENRSRMSAKDLKDRVAVIKIIVKRYHRP